MKKNKTIKTSILILITLLLTPILTSAFSASELNNPDGVPTELYEGGYGYTVENGEATITQGGGQVGEIIIPSTIGGYPVTALGPTISADHSVFSPNITSVVISDSVKKIGTQTFLDIKSLKSISIPQGVTVIGSLAFAGCEGLTKVIIPDSVIEIHDRAFEGCVNLREVTISENTILGVNVFGGCPYFEGETVTVTTEAVTTETAVNDILTTSIVKDTSVNYLATCILPTVISILLVIAIVLIIILILRNKKHKKNKSE